MITHTCSSYFLLINRESSGKMYTHSWMAIVYLVSLSQEVIYLWIYMKAKENYPESLVSKIENPVPVSGERVNPKYLHFPPSAWGQPRHKQVSLIYNGHTLKQQTRSRSMHTWAYHPETCTFQGYLNGHDLKTEAKVYIVIQPLPLTLMLPVAKLVKSK